MHASSGVSISIFAGASKAHAVFRASGRTRKIATRNDNFVDETGGMEMCLTMERVIG